MYLKIRLFELAKKALSLKYCILFMISPALKTSVTFLEKHYHTGTLLAFAGQQKVLAFAGRTAKCNTLGYLLCNYETPTSPRHPSLNSTELTDVE